MTVSTPSAEARLVRICSGDGQSDAIPPKVKTTLLPSMADSLSDSPAH
eukprot:CAMPEP_0172767966 /NCGR_PEP_ID=MMETSP1074-20121228/183865_1 /TAXON_ID=2916 /ORGANISM="Ceratium fusus, Strain PA161109" /LENGTH=47 /DNA_ID= /DNA_START= /DNA_END= /DNA_ORIENTATION=